jgi:hypothetical protein
VNAIAPFSATPSAYRLRVLLVAPNIDGTDVGEAFVAFKWAEALAAITDLTVLSFQRPGRSALAAQLPGARVVVCYDAAPYHTTSGRPQWGCTAGTGAPAVVKIGWTQKKLNSSEPTLDLANNGADSARPIVILPLIAGSTT